MGHSESQLPGIRVGPTASAIALYVASSLFAFFFLLMILTVSGFGLVLTPFILVVGVWLAWRFCARRAVADSEAIEIRGMWRTRVVPWEDVSAISGEPPVIGYKWVDFAKVRVAFLERGRKKSVTVATSLSSMPEVAQRLRACAPAGHPIRTAIPKRYTEQAANGVRVDRQLIERGGSLISIKPRPSMLAFQLLAPALLAMIGAYLPRWLDMDWSNTRSRAITIIFLAIWLCAAAAMATGIARQRTTATQAGLLLRTWGTRGIPLELISEFDLVRLRGPAHVVVARQFDAREIQLPATACWNAAEAAKIVQQLRAVYSANPNL